MYDLVTFGEAMLRLSPPDFQRLEQTSTLDVQVGGAEYNVAVAAARLGLRTAWVSRLPDNPLGRRVANKAREHGVDTSHVVWAKEGRLGVYFLEQGSSPRASRVLYDRFPSAMSEISAGEVDWAGLFRETRRFHTTGITPALGDGAAAVTREAMEAARAAGASVSYDLNFRGKLWSPVKARDVQAPLMKLVDLLITNEEDPRAVFGISAGQDESYRSVSLDAYRAIAEKLHAQLGVKTVAVTLRESPSVLRNGWSAAAWRDGTFIPGKRYEIEIVDRLGGGDSFAAGLLYGLATRDDLSWALDFGIAFSALKHTHPGDVNWSTREEAEALMKGGGARVQR